MKLEFEKKIKSALLAVKTASDKKIAEITELMNDWKNKYNDLEVKYHTDTTKLNMDIKNLTTSYKNQVAELEHRVANLEDQLALMRDERDKLLKKNKDLNNALIEWKGKYSDMEARNHELIEQHSNDLTK